jgi:ATP-dependent Lon protease
MPGLIVQALIRSGASNPVILLDEVDKISSANNLVRGSPESVLLEILDPEQHKNFRDSFLNFGIDLSHCLFICTCNSVRPLSRPLLDRLEIVNIDSYLEIEKMEIARKFLIPKSIEYCGLAGRAELRMSDDALRIVIQQYTAESGVRGLGRRIDDICRHMARRLVEKGDSEKSKVISLQTQEDVRGILGHPIISDGPQIPSQLPIGVSLGLAVTQIGGDILFIESVITGGGSSGVGRVVVTGQLGDVMKESIQASLALLSSRALNRGTGSGSIYGLIDANLVRSSDIHVHFPNGAIRKDGPSAGVATSIALASLFSKHPARSDLCSTGEITLRGDVMPIGGVRDKVIAAHRAGMRTVLLPWANRESVQDCGLPDVVKNGIEIVFVKTIDQVMSIAFPGIDVSRIDKSPRTKAAL